MNIKNIKVSTLLFTSLFLSMSLVITLGLIAINQNNKLQKQTETFFNHPYQVRLAIGKIYTDIGAMRLGQRDLLLNLSSESNSQEMEVLSEDIRAQFDIIKSQFLGDKKDAEKAYDAFLKWETALNESLDLAISGQKEQVIKELGTKGKLSVLKEDMNAKLQALDYFALKKAEKINAESDDYSNTANHQLIIVIAIFLAISVIANLSLLRTIRKPLKALANATESFHEGDMTARSSYDVKNEFGELSNSFNTMVASIQLNSTLDKKVASLAALMLSEYDVKKFFRATLSSLAEHTGSQMAAIYLLSDDKKHFEYFESIGLDSNARKAFAADMYEGEFGPVIASRSIQHIKNIPAETRFEFYTVSGKFTPREIISLPITADGEVVAIISLASINVYENAALLLLDRILVTLSARVEGILAFHKMKEFAEKLDAQNHELEAQKTELSSQSVELMAQNNELEMQKRQLSEVSRLKTNFLSNMSHELRTPLNSVIALSGVLNRRLANQIGEEEYSYLEVIERNGKHLLNLINDILDISRIEVGHEEVEVSSFNMNALIADVVNMIAPQANQKNIKLLHPEKEVKLEVSNDPDKCRHILQNLIGNAIKFTEKGRVEINAALKDSSIEITIIDSGIGIAEKHLPHIFDEFRQADGSTSRRFGGTGLGLAIAQKYANLLGGVITVKSTMDVGSEFTLTLPLHYTAEKRIAVAEPGIAVNLSTKKITPMPQEGNAAKTILLVEDSEPAVVQIKDFLESSGYNILVARNGYEALHLIGQTIPDAMILDLMMPEVDGFSVLQTIREAEATAHIPVLILTAKHITKEELQFLKRNNIHQLIQKGDVNGSELMMAVEAMVYPVTVGTNVVPQSDLPSIEGKPVILVVEDNEDNMTTVKALLAGNYIVVEAVNGKESIEMAQLHKPHLILMDIALPDMDGIEAFKNIRKNLQLQHTRVIALTASAMISDREAILSYGFDAYIAKPIDAKVFFRTINEILYGK